MTATKKNAVPTTAGEKLPMPCVGCHAMPHNTAPTSFMDQIHEQGRVQYRRACLAVPADIKPCQQATRPLAVQQPANIGQLAFYADEITVKLRDALGAYEGLEYMVSCSADHALPSPERLGSIIRSINEANALQLTALEEALTTLRAAIKAAQPVGGRV